MVVDLRKSYNTEYRYLRCKKCRKIIKLSEPGWLIHKGKFYCDNDDCKPKKHK